MSGDLLAVSDLHVGYRANREAVEALAPGRPGDWLVVAGDVGEYAADVEYALALLAARFERVIWTPGNHELWTPPDDPVDLRGEKRYHHLVEMCRRLGVVTPEDPYPVWRDGSREIVVAPLMTLYDYSFRPEGTDPATAIRQASAAGVMGTDELFLRPEPHASIAAWCGQRVTTTHDRLAALPAGTRTLLVNHFPLVRDPTYALARQEFALWCGTTRTADWHVRFNAVSVVYGHLHIPRRTVHDGVPFEEVSLGYPREWRPRYRGGPPGPHRIIAAGSGG